MSIGEQIEIGQGKNLRHSMKADDGWIMLHHCLKGCGYKILEDGDTGEPFMADPSVIDKSARWPFPAKCLECGGAKEKGWLPRGYLPVRDV